MPTTAREQGALTVIVEVDVQKVTALTTLLMRLGDVVDQPACPIDFRRLTTVHFMRWVVLPEVKDERGQTTFKPQLVLSTNYDLPRETHLRELVAVGGDVMQAIYSHCVGYQKGQDLHAYLGRSEFSYSPSAFYVGAPGLSVDMIHKERIFHEAIESFLDKHRSTRPASKDLAQQVADGKSLRVGIQAFVLSRPELRWVSEPENRFCWKPRYPPQNLVVVLILALVAFLAACVLAPLLTSLPWYILPVAAAGLLLLLVGVGYLWWRKLRADEEKPEEKGDAIKLNLDHIKGLVEREDLLVHNQLTHLVVIKPGWLRLGHTPPGAGGHQLPGPELLRPRSSRRHSDHSFCPLGDYRSRPAPPLFQQL